ncbi:MAG: hypothetical protein KBI47_09755 [Armatimonadetes bacterium]|nr:hypothetical protein [Armatimonadota bacterium]MDI9582612.1 hypothetical protein [Acidobacteriota bacterium]
MQGLLTFGTCGIRGIVGETITDEVVERVFRAVARHLGPFKRVCVARDTRPSSPAIESSLVAGLAANGLDVMRLGIMPTPGLYLLTRELGCDLGIMVTASHNPVDYNGFKFCDRNGMAPNLDALERAFYHPGSVQSVFPGQIHDISGNDVLITWLREICPPPLRPLKLVVDCACGPAGRIFPELLTDLGHEVIPVNCDLDLALCDRDPEPMPSTLEKTVEEMHRVGADGGICLDGDNDRVVFLDHEGCLGAHRCNAIMGRIALEQACGGDVIGSVETGRYVEEAVTLADGRLWRTKVGDAHVAREVRDRRAVIGMEECGHYILPQLGFFSSTLYASMVLLAHRDLNTIRQELAPLPELARAEKRVSCPEASKAKAMESVKHWASRCSGQLTNIDGVRVDWDDGWLLIRPSGTSPYMKVSGEADSPERLDELIDMGMSLVQVALAASR